MRSKPYVPVPKCAGCGKPCTTAYCDRCAPPVERSQEAEYRHAVERTQFVGTLRALRALRVGDKA